MSVVVAKAGATIDVGAEREEPAILAVLPCIKEKFVVDFANGIDVARDQLRVQRTETGFVSRLENWFTGKGKRRQQEINASVIDGVEGALTWLVELSGSLAESNLALARVNDRVNELKHDIATVGHYSAGAREQLNRLASEVDQRCGRLADYLQRVDAIQRARLNLDRVFTKWSAGCYADFSLAGRCYAALEELRWGAFGEFVRCATATERRPFIADLINKVRVQLAHDSGLGTDRRVNTRSHWLSVTSTRATPLDSIQALAYLGDWSTTDLAPFVFATTQSPEELPLGLPRLSSPLRVSEAMVEEVFEAAT